MAESRTNQNIGNIGLNGAAEIAKPVPPIVDWDSYFLDEKVADPTDLSEGGTIDTVKTYGVNLNTHYISWTTNPKEAGERGLGDPITRITARIPGSFVVKFQEGASKGQPRTYIDTVAVAIPLGLRDAFERKEREKTDEYDRNLESHTNRKINAYEDGRKAEWHERNQANLAASLGENSTTRGLDYLDALSRKDERSILREETRYRKNGQAMTSEQIEAEVDKLLAKSTTDRESRKKAGRTSFAGVK